MWQVVLRLVRRQTDSKLWVVLDVEDNLEMSDVSEQIKSVVEINYSDWTVVGMGRRPVPSPHP